MYWERYQYDTSYLLVADDVVVGGSLLILDYELGIDCYNIDVAVVVVCYMDHWD